MLPKFSKRIKDDRANAVVENVIVMPIVLVILIMLIVMSFVIHDKCTVESAAKRGAIYAAHCVSNPNYATILAQSGNQAGALDTSIESQNEFSFSGVCKNIKPFRYLIPSDANLQSNVKNEVEAIVENTRIPWRNIDIVSVNVKQNNKIFYQDINVEINVSYDISPIFKMVGMEPVFEYTVKAVMTVNDPDEFIRNADLVVDLITIVDNKTGNKISSVLDKISTLAYKIVDWTKVGS